MRIIFVRHGQDDDSRRGGWSSLGLLEEGKRQARSVAAYLCMAAEYKIGQILSSDLNRAMETAEYIAAALELSVQTEVSLRETNNGDLAGMPNSEALIKYPGLFWNTLEIDEPYPNGESPAEFYFRIKEWFENVLRFQDQADDLLVVTHGGVINVVYYLVNHLEWSNKKPLYPIETCSIHVLNTSSMTFEAENMIVW